MCDKLPFDFMNCNGVVENNKDGDVVVKGFVSEGPINGKIIYWAPAPAGRNGSFAGSGLPYSSPSQAFENTPNRGIVEYKNRTFEFKVISPNAYYKHLGSTYVEPHVAFKVCNHKRIYNIKLGNGIPFRTLTYASNDFPRKDCLYYYGKDELPVRTQEDIIRSGAYPKTNNMPENFWGMRPPQ